MVSEVAFEGAPNPFNTNRRKKFKTYTKSLPINEIIVPTSDIDKYDDTDEDVIIDNNCQKPTTRSSTRNSDSDSDTDSDSDEIVPQKTIENIIVSKPNIGATGPTGNFSFVSSPPRRRYTIMSGQNESLNDSNSVHKQITNNASRFESIPLEYTDTVYNNYSSFSTSLLSRISISSEMLSWLSSFDNNTNNEHANTEDNNVDDSTNQMSGSQWLCDFNVNMGVVENPYYNDNSNGNSNNVNNNANDANNNNYSDDDSNNDSNNDYDSDDVYLYNIVNEDRESRMSQVD